MHLPDSVFPRTKRSARERVGRTIARTRAVEGENARSSCIPSSASRFIRRTIERAARKKLIFRSNKCCKEMRGETRRADDSELGKFRETYDDERSLPRKRASLQFLTRAHPFHHNVRFHKNQRAFNASAATINFVRTVLFPPLCAPGPSPRRSAPRRVASRQGCSVFTGLFTTRRPRQSPETKNLIAPLFAYLPPHVSSPHACTRAGAR